MCRPKTGYMSGTPSQIAENAALFQSSTSLVGSRNEKREPANVIR
jgi:hypothetical protein